MQEVLTAISTVGFPIAMCLILVKLMNSQHFATQQVLKELSDTIANNTIVLTKIYERLQSNEK